MADIKGFHWADYVLFGSVLLLSFAVGVYQRFTGGRQKSTQEYLQGNRQLKMIPTSISMFMSLISAILVMGSTSEMYLYGTQQWVGWIGGSLGYIVTTVLFVPMIYKLKITSSYEYHALRFRSKLQRMISVIFDLGLNTLYMGLALYAPSVALEGVTGFPMWASVLCTGGLATIYTTIGGIKAAIWTDFFQGFILVGGLIAILIIGCIKVGGLSEVWEISKQGGRIEFFNMNPDPTIRMTFWTVTISSFIQQITVGLGSQVYIQRYVNLPTLREAKLSLLLQIPCTFVVTLLVNLLGLTVYAYYDKIGCDPLRSSKISSPNQLLPYFIVDAIGYPGLSGLLIAVLFSGALSSVSSSIPAMSTITWKDIIEPHCQDLSETKKTLIIKTLVFFYGALGIGFAFVFQNLTGHVLQLSSSVLYGIAGAGYAVGLVGSIFPWVQWKGMIAGILSGIGMAIWINVGQQQQQPFREFLDTNVVNCTFPGNMTAFPIPQNPEDVFALYQISFTLIGSVAFITTTTVALIVSFITGPTKMSEIDPRTVVNFPSRGLCCCVPKSHRDKCYCGVDYSDQHTQQKEEPAETDMDRDSKPPVDMWYAEKQNGVERRNTDYDNKAFENETITKF